MTSGTTLTPRGTGMPLDPRRNAVRPDLAADQLRGLVDAPRYQQGVRHQVMLASVPLRRQPGAEAGLDTEVLFGEIVSIYDIADGWAWVQLERDGYVGYVPADSLTPHIEEATHRVKSLGTFVYPRADIKAPPLMHLSVNSLVPVVETDEKFCRLAFGGYVIARHLSEVSRFERDFVEIAERLIGTPYLWGGRTRLGLDCSGLVQVAMEAAGLACPRDSDMQQAEVGAEVLVPANLDGLRRGDLVFWKGHVGIMADGIMLVHANAHHMAVMAEPLPEAVERIARAGSPLAAIKRLPGLSAVG